MDSEIKRLLEEGRKEATKPVVEVLRFMSLTEKRRAYSKFLEAGNYDTFHGFAQAFKNGTFDVESGAPVDLEPNYTKIPLRESKKSISVVDAIKEAIVSAAKDEGASLSENESIEEKDVFLFKGVNKIIEVTIRDKK